MGSGKTSMILLFAISFTLYYGSDMTIASPMQAFITDLILQDVNAIWTAAATAVLALSAVGIFVGFLGAGQALNFSIPSQILIVGGAILMNFILTPLSIINSVGMHIIVKVLIMAIFEILILSATYSFVTGRDW